MSKNTNATKSTKAIFAGIACAVAVTGSLLAATPMAAFATDYSGDFTYASVNAKHYEGEKVTIGEDWAQPVYAEWHRGDSGRWWATFWTYNYTKVWATPAPAGCGWAFYVYDDNGDFIPVYRCEESSNYNLYGKEGVSSHWSNADGTKWF